MSFIKDSTGDRAVCEVTKKFNWLRISYPSNLILITDITGRSWTTMSSYEKLNWQSILTLIKTPAHILSYINYSFTLHNAFEVLQIYHTIDLIWCLE